MITITESKPRTPKKTLNVKNCSIKNGVLTDEDGDVIPRIAEYIGSDEITIKISLPVSEGEAE